MLNQIVIVGRLVNEMVVKEAEDGKKVANITLACPRSYKNSEGEYDTDFINFILWEGIAENVSDYCKKGDILGIKGRLQTTNGNLEAVAEKVTFLSSKKSEE